MQLIEKLAILADAAKYDASCSSSGASGRTSRNGRGIGSTEGMGICHSYAPDGRCISLLKLLLTNFCLYECHYCINRKSSNTPRARFSVDEVVDLTLEFYRRNYIEGLFLSSGIIRSPDYTMEQVIEVARRLREVHDFRGYIHLKTIPEASPELIERAGRYADRLSINIELPTEAALQRLAPEKKQPGIKRSMARIRTRIDDRADELKAARKNASSNIASRRSAGVDGGAADSRAKDIPKFAPAGQSTQLVIGAEPSDDRTILQTSNTLYSSYRLRRVYYSAYSPIPDASSQVPATPAPLMREHRLYQADWLMRFYGYEADEITAASGRGAGMLDLKIDPKLAWACRHPEAFPVDINNAPREQLLRVPGLGVRTVDRLLRGRRWTKIRLHDLVQLKVSVTKCRPFIVAADHRPSVMTPTQLHEHLQPAQQLALL